MKTYIKEKTLQVFMLQSPQRLVKGSTETVRMSPVMILEKGLQEKSRIQETAKGRRVKKKSKIKLRMMIMSKATKDQLNLATLKDSKVEKTLSTRLLLRDPCN